jgi:transposase-like protein
MHIPALLAFEKKAGCITYFNAGMPVFTHDEKDIASFRMITAQFCASGNTKQADIARTFGIASVTVKRAVKRYREQGAKGFYVAKKGRGPAVLTAEVLKRAQRLLDEGMEAPEVAEQFGGQTRHVGQSGARGSLASMG